MASASRCYFALTLGPPQLDYRGRRRLGSQNFFQGALLRADDLFGQRFIEVCPVCGALSADHLASFVQAEFWWLLGIMLRVFLEMALVDVVRASCLRGRNLVRAPGPRPGANTSHHSCSGHILPCNAMVATLTFFPFILTGGVITLTSLDFLALACPPLAVTRRAIVGQSQPASTLLGITAFVVLSLMLSLWSL